MRNKLKDYKQLNTFKKQNDLLLKELKEREQKFEDYTRQLNEQKLAELQELKKDDKKEYKEQEIQKFKEDINGFKIEREQLMKKIEEQEKIVASVYDDARTKDHQLTERGSKIKHLETELHLLKTTKAVDTLVPTHVYSGKAASSDTMNKQENETKTNKLPCLQQPQFPKLSTYDGNNDWKSYYLQFEHTANRFEWNEEQKLTR